MAFAGTRSISPRSAARKLAPRRLVVGYFGQWSLYDHFLVSNLVKSGAAAHLDQINYAQGFVTGGRCSVADPNADLNTAFQARESVDGKADDPASLFRGDLHQIAELKRLHPRLKVLISLEGRAADFAADAQPAVRQAFVASCVDIFLRGHLAASPNVAPGTPDQPGLFDGIDVDWEYPGAENAANFMALLTELRTQMNAVRPGLRLSIAVGPSPRMYPAVDMTAVAQMVDQIGIMNYDYNGPWSHNTGFLAPLYIEEGHGGSVEGSIRDYKQAGAPAAKLLMGLPFYGYGWKAVGAIGNGLFQPGQGIRGDRPYSFFQGLMAPPPAGDRASSAAPLPTPATPGTMPIPAVITESRKDAPNAAAGAPALAPTRSAPNFVLFRDPRSRAPWLFDGSTFWTYEDPTSIRYKAAFALQEGIAGVMIWELSEDAPDAALVKAARSGIDSRRPPPSTRGSSQAE